MRPPPTIMRRASELLRVIAKPLLDGSDSGSQTEALKGAVHILPSRSRLGTSASDEGVVTVVMALLSFAGRHPELKGSRWATPPSLIQQRPRQSPISGMTVADCMCLTPSGRGAGRPVHSTTRVKPPLLPALETANLSE